MAGTAKTINTNAIHQGPGDLWIIGTAPTDAAPRLTLASDGTPDSVTHAVCTHLGAMADAVTTSIKPKADSIVLDSYDGPIALYSTELEAKIEAVLAQVGTAILQRALGVGTYSTGAGYKQVTFGGTLTVPEVCVAAISPKRAYANRHLVTVLYKAVATGGFQLELGRSKMASPKIAFTALADPARAEGKQVGIVFETLVDAAGGTPTAKAASVAEVQQGPCDLWLISPAPADANPRVTLDAATLTPDAAAHAGAKFLGAAAGGATFTVTPKIEFTRIDSCDAPVAAWISALDASLEMEMVESAVENLDRALGVGTYTADAAYAQSTFGGVSAPAEICIAAIAKKRTDPTKAIVASLFRVSASDGVQITMSRKKANTYKVKFIGLPDITRTAGKMMGCVHETI